MIKEAIESFARRRKNKQFSFDKEISDSYIVSFSLRKILALINGFFRFRKRHLVFIGRKCTIREKKKIKIGDNILIDDQCYIDALSKDGIVIGNNVSIHKRCIIECTGNLSHIGKGLTLGNNVGIGSNSFLGCAGGIKIGDDTIIGNFVSFHAENHNYSDENTVIRLQGVNHQGITIGKNCWIGAKATILDGAIVEDGCIIAAGAVVKQGLYQENSIYAGVPAKFIKKRF
jgi:acetyltransferase-like isoleucine patch superfamily enzyme